MIIEARSISKRSLFKLLIVGFGCGSLILWLLISALSMYASGSLTWEIEAERGLARFFDTFILWPVFALLWVAFTWFFLVVGMLLVNRFSTVTVKIRD